MNRVKREAERLARDVAARVNDYYPDAKPGLFESDVRELALHSFARLAGKRPKTADERATRAAKVAKRKSKRQQTRDVRAAVWERAKDRCECCGRVFGEDHRIINSGELDHFWGRARSESLESCWALCSRCHHEKTNNMPDAAKWLRVFRLHCESYNYAEQIRLVDQRLSGIVQMRAEGGR